MGFRVKKCCSNDDYYSHLTQELCVVLFCSQTWQLHESLLSSCYQRHHSTESFKGKSREHLKRILLGKKTLPKSYFWTISFFWRHLPSASNSIGNFCGSSLFFHYSSAQINWMPSPTYSKCTNFIFLIRNSLKGQPKRFLPTENKTYQTFPSIKDLDLLVKRNSRVFFQPFSVLRFDQLLIISILTIWNINIIYFIGKSFAWRWPGNSLLYKKIVFFVLFTAFTVSILWNSVYMF